MGLRSVLWAVSSIPDIRKCGRVRVGSLLPVKGGPEGVRMSGLCRCHSVWVCPVCAPVIRAARGEQIAASLRAVLETGGGATFGSATVPHGLGDSLRHSFDVVARAWRSVAADYSVKAFRKARGWGGVRTVEVTWGSVHGFHPHIHWLDLWDHPLLGDDRMEYDRLVFRAWANAVERLGMGRPSRRHGITLVPVVNVDVSDYMTRLSPASAGHELTAWSTKQARANGLTVLDVLRRIRDEGGEPWTSVLWEHEQATRGRRMLSWSPGLRERLELPEADPDPEPVATVALGVVRADDWDRIMRGPWRRGAQWEIECAAAVDGQVGIDQAVTRLLGLGPAAGDEGSDMAQEVMF